MIGNTPVRFACASSRAHDLPHGDLETLELVLIARAAPTDFAGSWCVPPTMITNSSALCPVPDVPKRIRVEAPAIRL